MFSRFAAMLASTIPYALLPRVAGIDVSRGSVRAVVKPQQARDPAYDSVRIPLPEGAFIDGAIRAPQPIVEAVRTVRLKLGVTDAVASVAEQKAFVYQTLVPHDASLQYAIESTLEAHIPLAAEGVVHDSEIVRTTPEGILVAVTAFPRSDIESLQSVFSDAGIWLRAIETEAHAFARAVLSEVDRSQNVMLVDLGTYRTRIAIADHGTISYSTTVDFGSALFVAALMKHLHVSEAEAQAIRATRGFLLGTTNRDVVEALAGPVSVLRDELERHRAFWNHESEIDLPRDPVSRILIAGSGARTLGLAEYVSDVLGLPVARAEVWQGSAESSGRVPRMSADESLEYVTAIGLSARASPVRPW